MKNKQNRLHELLAEVKVDASSEHLDQYLILLDELFLWSEKINLTAIRDREEAMEKHIVDSLTLSSLVYSAKNLLDIGSGAGFPSIPLKIAFPKMEIFSVEASRKKVHFQRHISRKLGLSGLKIVHSRVEILKFTVPNLPLFDIVVSRAVAPLGEILKLARPFLSASGKVIAMGGPSIDDEMEVVEKSGQWSLVEIKSFRLPASGSNRQLLVLQPSGK